MNSLMYEITVAEHPDFLIPYFGFRGIAGRHRHLQGDRDRHSPVIDGGLAGQDGGQIGAGILRAPIECFASAEQAYRRKYPG